MNIKVDITDKAVVCSIDIAKPGEYGSGEPRKWMEEAVIDRFEPSLDHCQN